MSYNSSVLELPEIQEIELLRLKVQALANEAAELAKQADSLEVRLIKKSADRRFPVERIARDIYELNQAFKLLLNRDGISMTKILKLRQWFRLERAI